MIVIHVLYFINALPVISYSRVLKRLIIVQMTKELPAPFSTQRLITISYLFFSDMKSHHWGIGSKCFKASSKAEMSKKKFCTTGVFLLQHVLGHSDT